MRLANSFGRGSGPQFMLAAISSDTAGFSPIRSPGFSLPDGWWRHSICPQGLNPWRKLGMSCGSGCHDLGGSPFARLPAILGPCVYSLALGAVVGSAGTWGPRKHPASARIFDVSPPGVSFGLDEGQALNPPPPIKKENAMKATKDKMLVPKRRECSFSIERDVGKKGDCVQHCIGPDLNGEYPVGVYILKHNEKPGWGSKARAYQDLVEYCSWRTKITHRICANCFYFDGEPGTTVEGKCRFHAPRPANDEETLPYAYWPRVDGKDWCGQHSQKPRSR